MRMRMKRSSMTLAPMLTSAIFVPNNLPEAERRNIRYGVFHVRIGTVVSRTPIPGTITAS